MGREKNVRSKSRNRILITGGCGFIGSHLSELLLNSGYSVRVVDDLSTGRQENVAHLLNNPDFDCVVGDISNEEQIDDLVRASETVIHLAAAVGVELIVKDPVRTIETNVLGTHNVLRAASRHNRKVMLASTSEIYGKNGHVPYGEEDDRILGPITRSRWSYSASKAVDEFLALAYHKQLGVPVVIFRLFNTIGPRQRGRYGMVVPRFVGQALRGEDLTVYDDGQQTRCFCDVRDVVRAILLLMGAEKAVGGIYNIGSTAEVTILELARMIIRLVNAGDQDSRKAGIVFVPYEEAYEAGFEDMRRRVPDISRIRSVVGWEPVLSLEESLVEIIQQFRVSNPAIELG